MARRVFFSFDYERDIWRANVVRNSWVTQEDREAAGFWDASLWEDAKKKGDDAIREMIDGGLENTSVTVVLIGPETAGRKWVKYEIVKSLKRGNGLLGIFIDSIEDQSGRSDRQGDNPLERLYFEKEGIRIFLSELHLTYDWILNNGYDHFASWVEDAALKAERGMG